MTTLTGGLDELFSRLPVAVYRSAPNGQLLAANPALALLLGYDSVSDLIHDIRLVESVYVDSSVRSVWLDTIIRDGVVHDFDIELRRRDGTTVWVEDTARGAFDDAGALLYCEGALIDVSEKVKAKKAQSEFIATVSHELRNPMSVLLGLAKELASDYDGFAEADRREMTGVMAQQAEDASWIIEDLLVAYRDDARSVSVFAEEFDVADEIDRVLEGIDHPVAVELGTGDARVLADPRRTRQILRNLVSNAVRYGGDVIKVETERTDGSVQVRVCDNGEPLDAEEADRIFLAFQQGSGRRADSKSVGLGLSVARTLADLMDGKLVYHHDGEFSSFIVTLPAAP